MYHGSRRLTERPTPTRNAFEDLASGHARTPLYLEYPDVSGFIEYEYSRASSGMRRPRTRLDMLCSQSHAMMRSDNEHWGTFRARSPLEGPDDFWDECSQSEGLGPYEGRGEWWENL